MSFDDAIAIEEFYAKKHNAAQRHDFISKMGRKLHNKENSRDRDSF